MSVDEVKHELTEEVGSETGLHGVVGEMRLPLK